MAYLISGVPLKMFRTLTKLNFVANDFLMWIFLWDMKTRVKNKIPSVVTSRGLKVIALLGHHAHR